MTLILFFAVSGLPPFSGLWPKVILVKASLDVGAWWLAGAVLLSGFLTTIAVGRVWVLSYWRPAPDAAAAGEEAGLDPVIDYAPLVMLTAIVVVLGVFPQQILELSQVGTEQLLNPIDYIRSVFPAGGAQ